MKRRNREINDYAAVPGWELMPPRSLMGSIVALVLKVGGVAIIAGLVLFILCVMFGL